MTRPPARGARRLTLLALFTAIALTIFMVEAQIPVPLPIPGVKLGLANIVTVYVMFVLGPGDALLVLSARVFLGAVFSGQMSTLLYSAGGGLLCWLALCLLRRVLSRDQIWLCSPVAAIFHNLGQLLVAAGVMKTWAVWPISPIWSWPARRPVCLPAYVPRCSSDIWRKYIKKLPTQRVGSFL